jgi:hypothetical protein
VVPFWYVEEVSVEFNAPQQSGTTIPSLRDGEDQGRPDLLRFVKWLHHATPLLACLHLLF